MSADHILAIDQGTTGTRSILVDSNLRVVASAYRQLPQHFPRPGWVEHDPTDIWRAVCDTIKEVLDRSGVAGGQVVCIGITNQRETSLVWRRDNSDHLHRAIVWQDRRTADVCERINERGDAARISKLTGLVVDPYFSATKISWVLDNVDGARQMARRGELAAGTVDSYLLWRLTGGCVHATDASNASRTMLWPLEGDRWSEEMSEVFDVPSSILPRVLPSAGSFGLTRGVPGLLDGIPICGMVGDQQSALFGQGCLSEGEAKCTFGTGAFIMLNTGSAPTLSSSGLLTTIGWRLGSETTYCLEGSVFMAGALVQWLRDGMGFFLEANQIEALAGEVEDSDGVVVVVPAHVGLGAPHWKPRARGMICGLTRGTTRAHVARAALEGIAHQVTDLLEVMTSETGSALDVLRVDGGATANDLLMQIQSDLMRCVIERPENLETTVKGAVLMAGFGAGIWTNLKEIRKTREVERRFEPSMDRSRVDAMRGDWKIAVSTLPSSPSSSPYPLHGSS